MYSLRASSLGLKCPLCYAWIYGSKAKSSSKYAKNLIRVKFIDPTGCSLSLARSLSHHQIHISLSSYFRTAQRTPNRTFTPHTFIGNSVPWPMRSYGFLWLVVCVNTRVQISVARGSHSDTETETRTNGLPNDQSLKCVHHYLLNFSSTSPQFLAHRKTAAIDSFTAIIAIAIVVVGLT